MGKPVIEKAFNGQNVAAAQGYSCKARCGDGIVSAGKNAPAASVEIEET